MPRRKHFTAREIDALIPRLEQIFNHVDECRRRAEAIASGMKRAKKESTEAELQEVYQQRSQIEFLLQAVQDDVDLITKLGGVTKDVESGLVDFPGQVNGEDAWLCWRRGEQKVRYWHAIDEGFQQRQALYRAETTTISH